MAIENKFRNKAGLSEYSFNCGHNQVVQGKNIADGKNYSVELYMDGNTFHVKAHDDTVMERKEWVVENTLSDARSQWLKWAESLLGPTLHEAKADKRFEVAYDLQDADDMKPWKVKLDGEIVATANTRMQALCSQVEYRIDNDMEPYQKPEKNAEKGGFEPGM